MPTLSVVLHVPGRTVPATLSTDHAASSHGQPVLLIDGDPHGPGDLTRWGPAATLRVEPGVDCSLGAELHLLAAWARACASLLRRWDREAAQSPEEARTADTGVWEVIKDVVLPDARILRVERAQDPENGRSVRIRLLSAPADEGVVLSTAQALAVLRALEAALELPNIEGDR